MPEASSPAAPAAELAPDELLRVLTQGSGATIVVVDRAQRIRWVNAAFADWFGLPRAALIGQPLRAVYGDYNFERIAPLAERALAGERLSYERQVRGLDGEDRWRTIHLEPWVGPEAGEIRGFVATAMNVDELKHATEALRAANQRLSSHIHNTPLALIELDAQLRLTELSPRAAQLFGLDAAAAAALQGAPLARLLGADPREHAALRMALKRLQTGEEASNRVGARLRRQAAGEADVQTEWFNSALTDAQGRPSSIMALVEDVTAREQAIAHEAAEARLRTLQAQIEPHFLFNTLANVQALIDTDGAGARRLLDGLVGYLRATLGAGRAGATATLGTELELTRRYLDVVALRMGPRLGVHWDVDEHDWRLRRLRFAPLLLQPLVESAIKYGIEPALDGGELCVAAHIRFDEQGEERALVSVSNSAAAATLARAAGSLRGAAPQPPRALGAAPADALAAIEQGLALHNVQQRLALLYGGAARFELRREPDGVHAQFELPVVLEE
jgi:PAS domain S-box-containing protein